ncbi:DUF4349 domain-containing protein [Sphingobacterium olei]|uniref:DUF4349 domain-containing protein n=1 Tax=Sphingobacterium olei TaxID=2571155 RepID=A0A4U0P6Y0_9SPHI|nr:DUF4349 domain-containing protein [Sphingobacterium olei]TJZ63231.1 DUF4349 domain-containing protein [Sphingobacterium olei]
MKKTLIICLFFSALILFVSACNQPTEPSYGYAAEEILLEDINTSQDSRNFATSEQESPSVENHPTPSRGKKIIRTGTISIESKDIKSGKKRLDEYVKKFEGYYEQESTKNISDLINYILVVRIPFNHFDAFLSNIENGEDKITQKHVQSQDVSIQYYDTEARLKSKQAALVRYIQLLNQAKNVKDILEIQEQIRLIQEEIDSQESVLRSLKDQIGYSTVSINLFEYQANLSIGSNSFGSKIKDAFSFSLNLLESIFLAFISLWPIWILTTIAIFLFKRYRNKRKNQSEKI